MNIPKGYKLVPVELTNEMRLATNKAASFDEAWSVAVESAPTPPQPIYDEASERDRFSEWANGIEGYSKEGTHYNWERFDMPYEKLEELWLACAQSRAKAGEVSP